MNTHTPTLVSVLTANMPHWAGLVLLGLVVTVYAACGLTTLTGTARRRRTRRHTAHRALTAQRPRQADQPRAEVTS